MIVDSQLLMHKKSHSACELTPPSGKRTSPHTSPLLKRAVSPSSERKTPRKSVTLPKAKTQTQLKRKSKPEDLDREETTFL